MLKELDIIQTIANLLPNAHALSDDTYWDKSNDYVYTTDLLIEGQHFSLDYFSAADLGWKAGAVNLSDIAAMGALPKFLLVSLGLPDSIDLPFIQDFYHSLQTLITPYRCQIIGGDTVGAPQVVVNITAIGQLPPKHHPGLRSLAKPGDYIVTTGYSGLSAAGLLAFQQKLEGFELCKEVHLRPQPKIAEGLTLSRHFERYALMDTSDGLADALVKIAQASQVKLEVNVTQIPLHEELKALACKAGQVPLELALYGGEDFQLVACIPKVEAELLKHFKIIGRVSAGEAKAVLVDPVGQTLEALTLEKTYHHFPEGQP